MALNQRYKHGHNIDMPVPSGTVAGNYVVVGRIKGFANIDRQDDGTASICRVGSFVVTAIGQVAGPSNAAISVGDAIYYNGAATPKFSRINTGTFVGAALSTLASGATGEIEVLLFEE